MPGSTCILHLGKCLLETLWSDHHHEDLFIILDPCHCFGNLYCLVTSVFTACRYMLIATCGGVSGPNWSASMLWYLSCRKQIRVSWEMAFMKMGLLGIDFKSHLWECSQCFVAMPVWEWRWPCMAWLLHFSSTALFFNIFLAQQVILHHGTVVKCVWYLRGSQ